MNLVSIANVVDAIEYLIDYEQKSESEVFIISDDESKNNNYQYIEGLFSKKLNRKPPVIPTLGAPNFFLSMLLKLLGRSVVNPCQVYSCQKLLDTGFKKRASFEERIETFADEFVKK